MSNLPFFSHLMAGGLTFLFCGRQRITPAPHHRA